MRGLLGLVLWLAALGNGVAIPLGLDLYRSTPDDNPLTPAKVALGRRLFNDTRLSRDTTLACATCHDPLRAFADDRVVAVGAAGLSGRRNVPTLVNRAYGASFFWDGRAESIEQQVVQPLVNPREMALTSDAVVETVRRDADYRRQFRAVFGRDPEFDDIARALATYVRTILSGDSAYDRFRRGDVGALTDKERRGQRVFFHQARCGSCHAGPNLTDEAFHNTGVAFRGGRLLDAGRFVMTGKATDRGAFKTPTLREVDRTAPYMHDGSVATLEDVVEFYNDGGRPNPFLDPILRPLRLTADEQTALVAFLRALTGTVSDGR